MPPMHSWNSRHISQVCALAVLLSGIAASRAFCAPTSAPEYVLDPTWRDGIAFLLTRGTVSEDYRASKPLRYDPIDRALRRKVASRDHFDAQLARHLWAPLYHGREFAAKVWVDAAMGPDHTPRTLPTARAAIRYRHPKGVTLYQAFSIRPRSARDDLLPGGRTAQFRTRVWNPFDALPSGGYVADFTAAYARVPVAGIEVTVGRQAFRWGPSRTGALTLSDASPPLDGVSVQGEFGPVLGTAVFATLNRMWHEDSDSRYLARRYFSAHRLHWRVSDSLDIAVMDTVLYGGEARQVEPYYLNPVLPFYASQFNATSEGNAVSLDDNAMIGADVRWTPAAGWSVYAEGLVDDFAYDPKSDDPNALAWTVGGHRAGLWDRGEARVEYTRVGRYVYTHLRQENQYTHFGAALGQALGNDSDTLRAEAAWWPEPTSRIALSLTQTRRGDSAVDDRYRGESDTAFLAGAATTTRSATLSGWRWFGYDWLILGSVSGAHVRNHRHTAGATADILEWRGSVGRRMRLHP
jgi:hypothetical protein